MKICFKRLNTGKKVYILYYSGFTFLPECHKVVNKNIKLLKEAHNYMNINFVLFKLNFVNQLYSNREKY